MLVALGAPSYRLPDLPLCSTVSLRLAVVEVVAILVLPPVEVPVVEALQQETARKGLGTRRPPLPRRATMAEMALVLILLALVVEAALVPSVETALALPLQVSAVLVVLVVLHRLLARP